jgi:hypothetical protein
MTTGTDLDATTGTEIATGTGTEVATDTEEIATGTEETGPAEVAVALRSDTLVTRETSSTAEPPREKTINRRPRLDWVIICSGGSVLRE